MEKQVKHVYGGMKKDINKSNFPNQYYFEGRNIKLTATDNQTSGVISNTKGNSKLYAIPTPVIDYVGKSISYNGNVLTFTTNDINYNIQSGPQYIIGNTITRNSIILLTTDNNGIDCIWKVDSITFDIKLLYLRNLGFSTKNLPQIINNFENELIDKIYWVDGKSQLRFLNINHSIVNGDSEELIDVPISIISIVGDFNLSQPVVTNIVSGGTHTSGMIQYAYNLYRLNSSQTKISPLSQLVSLDKGTAGGGKINELVGSIPVINISNIDGTYSNIKVYSIKYNAYNQIPTISLIEDRELPTKGNVEIFDDGTAIQTISLEEFTFLGSDIIIPKHVNTKENRLFLSNYKEINFDVDLDFRAFSYNNLGNSVIYKDLTSTVVSSNRPYPPYDRVTVSKPTGTPLYISTDADYNNPELVKHDSVNLDYNTYKYQKDGRTFGGEGKYLKYELTKSTVFNPDNKYFKDEEIYRIGIEFYNKFGQVSLPKWIADFKSLDGNLIGQYNTLSVTLKQSFFDIVEADNYESEYQKPIGYKVIVAERTLNDKTIVANGILSPMMINIKSSDNDQNAQYVKDRMDTTNKLPNILIRNFNRSTGNGIAAPLRKATNLAEMSISRKSADNELPRAYTGDKDTAGRGYQYNAMVQMYSPEILFNGSPSLSEGLELRIKGSLKNTENNSWAKIYDTNTSTVDTEGRILKGMSPYIQTTATFESIKGSAKEPWELGLVSHHPGNSINRVTHVMYDRVYGGSVPSDINTNKYQKSPVNINYGIYGKPELTEVGATAVNYNNDPKYRYENSLVSILTDGNSQYDNDGPYNRKIISISSNGNKAITIVPGNNLTTTSSLARPTFESMGVFAGITGDDNGLLGELVKTDAEIYLGNIYGGNSFEDKKRTNYIGIGNYQELNVSVPTVKIESPGDTFVNFFKFARIMRTDNREIAVGIGVLEETVTVLCETTIDLKNRSDISFNTWTSRFQPQFDEYHDYNNVYSQMSNLIKNRDVDYNIKKLKNFDTNIISTKSKSSGETIDNWTDISPNDVITLDGKYGAINALVNFNDEIYSFQDTALSFISINPRVQVQGGDGLSLELGTGSVLDRYKYISTTSGSLNKWGIISTPAGMYYYDVLNNTIMSFSGQIAKLSDIKGLHQFFTNEADITSLKVDNPVDSTGVTLGYDYINNMLYLTFKQTNKDTFTLSYSEMLGEFTSFHDGIPSLYISRGNLLLTTDKTNRFLYNQNIGEYNRYYDELYPSSVTLNVNPESDKDCIFNNLEYKSEMYLDGVDIPNQTLTSVMLYNEYQDSGLVPLTLNSNISRKFREWRVTLPRQKNTRNRIRNPWVFLKLQIDNANNKEFILHNLIVKYTV